MTKLKNSVESFHNSLGQSEDRMNELEDRSVEITQSEQQTEQM